MAYVEFLFAPQPSDFNCKLFKLPNEANKSEIEVRNEMFVEVGLADKSDTTMSLRMVHTTSQLMQVIRGDNWQQYVSLFCNI